MSQECRLILDSEKGKETETSRRSADLQTPWFLPCESHFKTCDLQNCQVVYSCCWEPLSVVMLQQPQKQIHHRISGTATQIQPSI